MLDGQSLELFDQATNAVRVNSKPLSILSIFTLGREKATSKHAMKLAGGRPEMVLPPAFLGTLHEQEANMHFRLQLICEGKVVADTADARSLDGGSHPVVGQTVNWKWRIVEILDSTAEVYRVRVEPLAFFTESA